MDHTRKKAGKTWINRVPSSSVQKKNTKQLSRNKPSDKIVDAYIQSKHNLLNELDGNSSLSNKRTVLGDKMNMLQCRNKQNIESISVQEEKSLRRSTRRKVADKAFQSQKLHVNKKLSFDKASLTEKNEYSSQTSKEAQKERKAVSESLSDKCIYADVKRQTLINKNLPVEEKLAQYEFEVDENEPVAKRKKKRNVKRKNKNQSDENYHPGGHVFEHILKVGCDLAEKDIKERPRRVNVKENTKPVGELAEKNFRERGKKIIHDRNVKLKHQSSGEIQAKLLNEDVPVQLLSGKRGVQTASPSESSSVREDNCVSHNDCPEEIKILQKVEVEGLEDECTELELSITHRNSNCDLKIFEKTPCPELNESLDTLILGETDYMPSDFEGSFEVSEPRRSATPVLRDSSQFDSRKTGIESIPNFLLTSGSNNSHELATLQPTAEIRLSTPTRWNAPNQRRLLMELNSLATPGLNQSEGRDRTVNLDSSSTIFSAKPPPFLSQEVMHLPRVGGDDYVQDNNKLTKEWNVENYFGFDDAIEETEVLPPVSNATLKQKLWKTTLTSSTPLQKSINKLEHSSLFFKVKPLTPAISQLPRDLPKSNFKKKDKAPLTPQPDKLETCPSAKLSPFSNVLKQTKIDFTPNSSKTSTDETPKHKNGDTPLLFKYADDNTPTHFKEPPRRSYVRSVRRKMKPLGDEWIEVDSESEEEEEQKAARPNVKRTKRGKVDQQDKEAQKWMKTFNNQCEEIEGFELCVE